MWKKCLQMVFFFAFLLIAFSQSSIFSTLCNPLFLRNHLHINNQTRKWLLWLSVCCHLCFWSRIFWERSYFHLSLQEFVLLHLELISSCSLHRRGISVFSPLPCKTLSLPWKCWQNLHLAFKLSMSEWILSLPPLYASAAWTVTMYLLFSLIWLQSVCDIKLLQVSSYCVQYGNYLQVCAYFCWKCHTEMDIFLCS